MGRKNDPEQLLNIEGELVPYSELSKRERAILEQGRALGIYGPHAFDASHLAIALIALAVGLLTGTLLD